MKRFLFCNNCGKQGHVFHNCRKPINSYGVIAYRLHQSEIEYLMICRKDSLGYIDFIRGKYPEDIDFYLQNIINEMTLTEKQNLLNKEFDFLWNGIWGHFQNCKYHNEIISSSKKFDTMKQKDILHNYIKNSTSRWETPEWGFPKGRRNNLEIDLHCAIREFQEETGVYKKKLEIIKNILPFSEIFMGSNLKIYKNQYFVAKVIDDDYTLENFQREEVSNIAWKKLEDCLACIRPYNIEKRNLLLKVDKMLKNNQFI